MRTGSLKKATRPSDYTARSIAHLRLSPLFVACLAVAHAQAADLSGIIREAVKSYPTITAAQIAVQSAEAQTKQYKLLHMPTFGAQASRAVTSQGSQGSALTGKLNIYSGGSIEERIRVSEYNEAFQGYKVDETAEELAYTIAQTYLAGLSTKEQIVSAQDNFNRHQKIINDLQIITRYDEGRRSDLLQAQSRQLQVKTRILQLESDLRTAENKLQKYLPAAEKVEWHQLDNISNISTDYSQHPSLLAQYAEEQRAESQAKLSKKQRRPTLDLDMTGGGSGTRAANLVVNWTFFDLSTAAGQDVAENELRTARAKTEDIRRSIDERVMTAKIEAEHDLVTIEGAKAQVVAARQVADAYDQQYMIARRSILDVLNAYSELSGIESAVISAQSVYRQALVTGKYAAGQLVQWALHPPVGTTAVDTGLNNSQRSTPVVSPTMPTSNKRPTSKAPNVNPIEKVYGSVDEPVRSKVVQQHAPDSTTTSSTQPTTKQTSKQPSKSVAVVTPAVAEPKLYANVDEPRHITPVPVVTRQQPVVTTAPTISASPVHQAALRAVAANNAIAATTTIVNNTRQPTVYPNVDVPAVTKPVAAPAVTKSAIKTTQPIVPVVVEKVYPNIDVPSSKPVPKNTTTPKVTNKDKPLLLLKTPPKMDAPDTDSLKLVNPPVTPAATSIVNPVVPPTSSNRFTIVTR